MALDRAALARDMALERAELARDMALDRARFTELWKLLRCGTERGWTLG